MKKINTTLTIISLVLLCTLVSFVGCSDMMATLGNISLTIDLDTPEVEVASYILEGNLVDSNSRFTLNNIVPPRHTLSELKEGRWNLTVKAFDDQDNQIGIGTKAIDLRAGQVVDTSLLVVFGQSTPLASAFTIAGPSRNADREGTISVTTAKMEYRLASAAEDAPFTACTAGSTNLAPGSYKIRYAAAHGLQASECLTVTVPAYTQVQLTITSPTLTTTKEYDGTNTVQGSITPGAPSGVRSGDKVVVHAQASYDSASVGNSKNITVAYSLSGADALNYTKPDDTIVNTGVINQKQLSISGTTVTTNKEYDGLTSAAVTNDGTLDGKVGTEAVTVTATASYQDKSAGTGKLISVSYALGGADAGNYRAPASTSFSGEITKKALTVNPPSIRLSKEYDGTPTAVVTAPGSLGGVLTGDSVTLLESARYTDKDVGSSKSITVSYTFTGSDANNYATPSDTTVTNGVISQKQLTVTNFDLVSTKEYDGSSSSTINNVACSGIVPTEDVQVNAIATYNSPAAGANKPITVTYSLVGNDRGNYLKPADSIATATGEIAKKQLTVSGTSLASKDYDGTASAPIDSHGTLEGVIDGDTVTLSAVATYATKTAGSGKQATVVYTLLGADKDKYLAPENGILTGTINKATYDMTGVTFEGSTVTYSGNSNSLQIAGTLPTDVSVTYTNNEKTDAGTYTVTARFIGDSTNYNTIPDMTASLIITPLVMSGEVFISGNRITRVSGATSSSYGETLTADISGLENVGPNPTYVWMLNRGRIGGIGPEYVLKETDFGTISLAVNATTGNYSGQIEALNWVNTSIATGPSIDDANLIAYFPSSSNATKRIINITGFSSDLTGDLEAKVAIHGTDYGTAYTPLEVDSRNRAMIQTSEDVTVATKVMIRYKRPDSSPVNFPIELDLSGRELAVGDYYAGGVVGYIYQSTDTGYIANQVHGLIAAKTDTTPARMVWSTENTLVGGTSSAMGEGSSNTDKIISALGANAPAAQAARAYTDGINDDWFLPSLDELREIRNNRVAIGNFQSQDPSNDEDYIPYWTSTEYGFDGAEVLPFREDRISREWYNYKYDQSGGLPTECVRPVRYF